MNPTFFDEVELRYMKQFPKQTTTRWKHIDKMEAYHQLLENAMKRNSVVTQEKIKAYLGDEAYEKEVEYRQAWDEVYHRL